MPRFSLREFSRPDYASFLPKKDPNNAIWPRISMLAKMLNEIPWFKKSAQDKLAEQSAADMEEYTPNSEQQDALAQQNRAENQMEGYTPDNEPDGLLHVEDLDNEALPSYMGWDFDYKTATPEQLKVIQKLLKEGGYDLGKSGPRKDGVDGKRGNKTLAAYIDYNKKLQGSRLWNQNRAPDEEQDAADFAKALSDTPAKNMEGYKPAPNVDPSDVGNKYHIVRGSGGPSETQYEKTPAEIQEEKEADDAVNESVRRELEEAKRWSGMMDGYKPNMTGGR